MQRLLQFSITNPFVQCSSNNFDWVQKIGSGSRSEEGDLIFNRDIWGVFVFKWRDNVIHHLLMNIMLSCPASDIFVDLVDTSENKKIKEYIAGELKRYIKKSNLCK